jgi:hypothetical protein
MALAVEFDDETRSRAVEISNVTGNRRLTAELEPIKTATAQAAP